MHRKSVFTFQETLLTFLLLMSFLFAQEATTVTGPGELGRTWYDYAANSVSGRTSAQAFNVGTDGIHFLFAKQFPQSAPRVLAYDYFNDSLKILYGNTSFQGGRGRVLNGADDEAIICMDGPVRLIIDSGEALNNFITVLELDSGLFGGQARAGDTLVVVAAKQAANGFSWAPGYFKYSTDYGQTWLDGANVPLPPGALGFSEAERWPEFNPQNPPELSYLVDGGWIERAWTEDFGATWERQTIITDTTIFPDSSQYIVENFLQMNGMYSHEGAYHVVFGAVQGIKNVNTSALIDLFPVLYWNSREQEIIWLTSEAATAPGDTATINGLSDFRPGNGLGNAYPQLAEGPNGDLVAIWQQWEDDGAGGLITVLPNGGATEIFMTDVWGAYSPDDGRTWSEPFYLAGTPAESDIYPNITREFFWNTGGDSILLDIIYFRDTNPGISILNQSDPSECIWYYEQVAVAFSDIVGIPPTSYSSSVAEQFILYQNYPNPFNPATTIRYYLAKPGEVALEVYDVTGRKVAALEKGRKPAGEHKVNFDAAGLTSGIYFYRLKAGSFHKTRKMIFIE